MPEDPRIAILADAMAHTWSSTEVREAEREQARRILLKLDAAYQTPEETQ